jgi:hypothetical protein
MRWFDFERYMRGKLNPSDRDLILLHIVFSLLCVVVLYFLSNVAIGVRLLFLVIAYNTLVPLVGKFRNHTNWLSIWVFVFPLSLLLVFPDWYLAAQLNVIVFPDSGFLSIGTIPIYMAGLWAIPLFIIVYIGDRISQKKSMPITYLTVAILSLTIFGISEETLWALPAWYAQNVTRIGHVAIYIIIPEIMLGISTFIGYNQTREKLWWKKIIWAYIIMVLYLGNASLFYFLIEHMLLV